MDLPTRTIVNVAEGFCGLTFEEEKAHNMVNRKLVLKFL